MKNKHNEIKSHNCDEEGIKSLLRHSFIIVDEFTRAIFYKRIISENEIIKQEVKKHLSNELRFILGVFSDAATNC